MYHVKAGHIMYTVYVLHSRKFDKIYIGYTSDLESRIKSHNELATKGWTVKYRPWEVVYTEEYESKSEAMGREKELKSHRGRDFIRTMIIYLTIISTNCILLYKLKIISSICTDLKGRKLPCMQNATSHK